MRGANPGVIRRSRKWHARVPLYGRWLWLGSLPTEWEAARVCRRARLLTPAELFLVSQCRGGRARLKLLGRLLSKKQNQN